jgi:hypothetical protein
MCDEVQCSKNNYQFMGGTYCWIEFTDRHERDRFQIFLTHRLYRNTTDTRFSSKSIQHYSFMSIKHEKACFHLKAGFLAKV